MRLRMFEAPEGRPWSRDEIDRMIPAAMDRKEQALLELKEIADLASDLKWIYTEGESVARRAVRAAFAGQRTSAEDRTAEAMLYEFAAGDLRDGDEFVGQRLVDIGRSSEMAQNAYRDQRKLLDAFAADLEVLRTLHVSAREAP